MTKKNARSRVVREGQPADSADEGFAIDERIEGTSTVIAPRGDVDMATVPKLEARLQTMLAANADVDVIIDLSAVGFMDSTGVALLIHASRAPAHPQGRVKVRNATGQVLRLLELCGLVDELLS